MDTRRAARWGRRVLAGTAVLLAASCPEVEEPPTYQLATVLSATGPLAQVGRLQLEAARLAVEEINRAGGVLGRDLEIVSFDDRSGVEQAREAAVEVVARGIPVVLGAVGSALTQEVAADVVPHAVVVSGSSTASSLSTVEDQGYLFRTCASEVGQAKLLADRARRRGFSRLAIIHPPAEDELGLGRVLRQAFRDRGGQVVLDVPYVEGAVSHYDVVARLVEARPDAVVLDANPVDGASILQDYVTVHASAGISWYFTDKVEDETFVAAVGASAFSFPHEGTGPGTPGGTRYSRFQDAFRERTGGLPTGGSYAANVYDAVYLVALAASAAGTWQAQPIRDALGPVSLGGAVYTAERYAEAVAALQQHKDINYEGVSGSVDLNPRGDTTTPYDVWAVKDGRITILERAVLAPP